MTQRRPMVPLAATLVAGVMLAWPSPAVADPSPADPVIVDPATAPPAGSAPPVAGVGTALAQSGAQPAGPLGLPDLAGYAPGLILGQNAVPSAPGDPTAVTGPALNAFDSQYLLAQNVAPAAPGQGVQAGGLGPSPEDPGTGRLAFLRRLHEMYAAGALSGALLGQAEPDQPAP
ncbi:hypothetical protein ACXDF8_23665 [Mycolicibacterium sp. CBM1]